MAVFTLYHGDLGENKISVLPQLEKGRLIDLQMYLAQDPKNPDETAEFILPYNYNDVVLLRDYLTSVINLYEKTQKRKISIGSAHSATALYRCNQGGKVVKG